LFDSNDRFGRDRAPLFFFHLVNAQLLQNRVKVIYTISSEGCFE